MKQAVLPLFRVRRTRRLKYVETDAEAAVLRECLRYLHTVGIPHWRANTGATTMHRQDGSERFVQFGVKGQADILGVIPRSYGATAGRLLAVETKAPGEQPSADQVAFLGMVERAGGVAIVAHSARELAEKLTAATAAETGHGTELKN